MFASKYYCSVIVLTLFCFQKGMHINSNFIKLIKMIATKYECSRNNFDIINLSREPDRIFTTEVAVLKITAPAPV